MLVVVGGDHDDSTQEDEAMSSSAQTIMLRLGWEFCQYGCDYLSPDEWYIRFIDGSGGIEEYVLACEIRELACDEERREDDSISNVGCSLRDLRIVHRHLQVLNDPQLLYDELMREVVTERANRRTRL